MNWNKKLTIKKPLLSKMETCKERLMDQKKNFKIGETLPLKEEKRTKNLWEKLKNYLTKTDNQMILAEDWIAELKTKTNKSMS